MGKLTNLGLPLLSNLMDKNIDIGNPLYSHGCDCMEDEVHLFFNCQIAKYFWFTSLWSVRWNYPQLQSLMNFIGFLCEPQRILSIHQNVFKDFFLYSILISEIILNVRNKVLHNEKIEDVEVVVFVLKSTFGEFKFSKKEETLVVKVQTEKDISLSLISLLPRVVKFNTTAAIRNK